MKPVTFDRTCYRIDGKPVYIFSGEFHYFRVPRRDWRRRMELFKQAGGNCLATYIPWLIHEPVEGQVIFGAEDGRYDLEGFLRTAAAAGLYVMARPGPYQYSELKYDGLPTWLCDNYPQLRAHTIEGKDFRVSSVSYLHPLFLEKTARWYGQVCPLIAKHSVKRGGPVAFVQFDNEMGGVHWWVAGHDYNAEAMGIGKEGGRYPEFLRRRHGSLAVINRRYGANYRSFAEVRPILPKEAATPFEICCARDYFDFYEWATGEYARTLAGMMRGNGIDVPLIHNSPNPSSNAQFMEVVDMVPPPFLLGSDHYYNLGPSWPQNSPTPQYALGAFYSCEVLRLMGFPPTVFELPGGSCSDWPPILPQDSKACYLANVALGMKGSNIYIFTGGPNLPGTGTTSDIYDFNAPIGPRGEVRPLYHEVKAVGLYLKANPWLVEAERVGDCRLALDFDLARSDKYWKSRGKFLFTGNDGWEFQRKGILTSAFCAGLSPMCCDLRADDWINDRSTPLMVVDTSSMARAKQERLVRYLKGGGKLLIAPVLPEVDEHMEPCTILADFLGRPKLSQLPEHTFVRLTIGGVVNVNNSGEVFVGESISPQAQAVGLDEASGKEMAWTIPTQGGGTVLLLGFRWQHALNQHGEMLASLMGMLGWKQKVKCSNPNVWTSLRTDGKRAVLFLMNLFSSPLDAEVRCWSPLSQTMIDLGHHALGAMTVKAVELKAAQRPAPAKTKAKAKAKTRAK